MWESRTLCFWGTSACTRRFRMLSFADYSVPAFAGRLMTLDWIAGAWAVFAKDARLELRTRVALGALVMFVAASLLLVWLSLGGAETSPSTAAALLWIVVVFASAVGLGRVFVAEEERGTTLLLQLALRPAQVLAGKLVFNAALTVALSLFAGAGFRLLLPVRLGEPALFWLALVLGALAISAATTILSAVIARAQAAGPLLPVLVFPVLVPILLPAVALTELASFAPADVWAEAQSSLVLLVAYAGLLTSLSFVLFDHVWRD